MIVFISWLDRGLSQFMIEVWLIESWLKKYIINTRLWLF